MSILREDGKRWWFDERRVISVLEKESENGTRVRTSFLLCVRAKEKKG